MKKTAKHTPKKAAKKSAVKRVRKPSNRMAEAASTIDAACAKMFKPIDEDSDDFRAGVSKGVHLANEEIAKELDSDPWVQYNLHKSEVEALNHRLDEVEKEKQALLSKLREEYAHMEGFRVTIIRLSNQVPHMFEE